MVQVLMKMNIKTPAIALAKTIFIESTGVVLKKTTVLQPVTCVVLLVQEKRF